MTTATFTTRIYQVESCTAHPFTGTHYHGEVVNEYGRDEARSPAFATEAGVKAWADDTIAGIRNRKAAAPAYYCFRCGRFAITCECCVKCADCRADSEKCLREARDS